MRAFTMGFLIGVSLIFVIALRPSFYVLFLSGIPVVLAVFYKVMRRGTFFWWVKVLLGCCLGASWLVVYLNSVMPKPFPHALESKQLVITGRIASIPKHKAHFSSFLFSSAINHQKRKIRLSWYGWRPPLMAGQCWRLTVKLKRIHGLRNPAGFDYDRWAFSQGISASGYVVAHSRHQKVSCHHTGFSMLYLRNNLANKMQALLVDNPALPFILALTIGDKHLITQKDWRVFQATGTSHLAAISGLHIGFVAALIFFLVKIIWRFFPRLCLLIPAQQGAALMSLLAALLYSALAGFATPTQRALTMLAIGLTALFCKRILAPWHAFMLAILIVLLINPLSILTMSFWLSFSAVGVILYGLTGRAFLGSKFKQMIKMQWVVGIGLVPLSLLFFYKASLVAFIANVIAIPWVSFIVVPSSLLGVVFLYISHHAAYALLTFAACNMQLLWHVLIYFSQSHFALFHIYFSGASSFVAVSLAVLLCLSPKGFPCKYLSIVLLLPLFVPMTFSLPPNQLKLVVFDVGEGLSVLVQKGRYVLLYDTGAHYADQASVATSSVIPYLKKEGITTIDAVMISHFDNDHVGGLNDILKAFKVKHLYTPPSKQYKALASWQRCQKGLHWQWGTATFNTLFPKKHEPSKKRNNLSCVLMVHFGVHAIILPGDIEKSAEHALVAQEGHHLKADVLIVPHHGSATSSSWRFLQAVHPKVAIISSGYRNRFHFPSQKVLARYRLLGAHVYNTASAGMVKLILNATQSRFRVDSYVLTHAHLWL